MIGAAIGILYAPKSGKETREEIGKKADEILNKQLFQIRMVSGANWVFRTSDLIILLTMILLFIELIKSTYVSSSQMIDHGLSMLVFIACLVEFLLQPKATTSVFFFIMTAALASSAFAGTPSGGKIVAPPAPTCDWFAPGAKFGVFGSGLLPTHDAYEGGDALGTVGGGLEQHVEIVLQTNAVVQRKIERTHDRFVAAYRQVHEMIRDEVAISLKRAH